MSVFHRIDHLDQVSVSVFLPRMARLHHYDGAVRHASRVEVLPAAPDAPVPASVPVPVTPHTREELAALNQTREYGPLGLSQQVGVFDLG